MSNLIRVLFVDDNEDLRNMMCRLIDSAPGMKSAGSIESADALEAEVEKRNPDVVLIDLTMPGRSPLLAIHALSKLGIRVKVVAYSGHDDPETISSALDAGASELVSKSLDPQSVVAAIRRICAAK